MANSRTQNDKQELVTVNAAPVVGVGYYTEYINARTKCKEHGAKEIFFSITGTGEW